MKALRRKLGAFLTTVALSVVALLVLLMATVTFWPQLLINPATLSFAARAAHRFVPSVTIRWKTVQTHVESHGFFQKQIGIAFNGLCLAYQPTLHSCFERLQLGAEIRLVPPSVTEIGPVRAIGGVVQYIGTKPQAASKRGKSQAWASGRVPSWLRQARLRPLTVDINPWSLQLADQTIIGSLGVTTSHDQYRVSLVGDAHDLRARALLTVSSQTGRLSGPFLYELSSEVKTPEATATIRTDGTALGGPRLSGSASGQLARSKSPAALTATLPSVAEFRSCVYALSPAQSSFDCPVRIPLPGPRAQKNRALLLLSRAKVITPTPFNGDVPVQVHFSVDPRITPTRLSQPHGGLTIDGQVIPAAWSEPRGINARLAVDLEFRDFGALVRSLADTAFAIPAPFGALEGVARLRLQGRYHEGLGVLRPSLSSRLSANFEKADVTAKGSIVVDLRHKIPAVAANLDLVLDDLQVVAPPLGLSAPPLPLPDPRIASSTAPPSAGQAGTAARPNETAQPAKPQAPRLRYRLAIHTPPDHPLRILWQYAETPVPITVNALLTERIPFQAQLHLGAFPLDFFGRREQATAADLTMTIRKRQTHVEGRIDLKDRKEPVRLRSSELAAESLVVPAPTLPLPFLEVLSATLGLPPLQAAVANPALAQEAPANRRAEDITAANRQTAIELRHRY